MRREKKPRNQDKKPRKGYFKWLFQMFYQPRATLTKVGTEDVSNKLTPLLFISVMVVLAVLIAAPVKPTLASSSNPRCFVTGTPTPCATSSPKCSALSSRAENNTTGTSTKNQGSSA